jgi:hypothetical protein
VLAQEIKGLEPQSITLQLNSRAMRFTNCLKYAKFLKQPLELWMFVPCDENGNTLQEPTKYSNWTNFDYSGTDIGFEDEKLCREYQKAKEACIFEYNILSLDELNDLITQGKTIEYLINYHYEQKRSCLETNKELF